MLASVADDKDYCALHFGAQHLYEMLLRQRDISACGVQNYNPARLARQAAELTVELVDGFLAELVAGRFVIFDPDTAELTMRTYLRNDGVLKIQNRVRAAGKQFRLIHSPTIRDAVVDQLPPELRAGWPDNLARLSNDQIKDACTPYPQETLFSQDADAKREVSHTTLRAVDNPPPAVHNTVEREQKVLAAIVERRIAHARSSGTVIRNLPAYNSTVVDQVRLELWTVVQRAVADNPTVDIAVLAAVLEPDPVPLDTIRTFERPSIDARTGFFDPTR